MNGLKSNYNDLNGLNNMYVNNLQATTILKTDAQYYTGLTTNIQQQTTK